MSTTNTMALFTCLTALLGGCDSNELYDRSDNTADDVAMPDLPEDDKPTNATPPSTDDAFGVTNHFPQVGDDNIALTSPITVDFSEPLLDESFDDDLVSLTLNGSPVSGVQHIEDDGSTVHFIPDTPLQPNAIYQVRVSDQVMSESGQVPKPLEWQFRTVADVHTTAQDIIDQCMSEMDINMLASVNAARATSRNCGEDFMPAVDKLTWDCNLQAAAIGHAVDMSDSDFFAHAGSDGSSIGTRVTRAGYPWSYVGENLAAGQRTISDVMSSWLDSPGHCRNIMSPNYTQFGFGYSTDIDSQYQRYWAQVFARPR